MLDPALELSPHNLVPGSTGFFLIAVLHIAVPAVMFVLCYVRALRARKQALSADVQEVQGKDATKPLNPGPACIHGPVEYAHGEEHALRVTIEQTGQDVKGKGDRWSHTWTETSRRVISAPFFVNDPRGRVRVEPDAQTLLVDKLDRTVRKSTAVRTRIAEIMNDEAVYVVGQLDAALGAGGAYREGEGSLVMRNPPNGRLLVSTEPLGNRFRAAMRMQRGFGIFFTIFLLVFVAFDMPFFFRKLSGRVERGIVTATHPHGGKSSYCELDVELPNKRSVNLDTGYYVCSQVKPGAAVNVTVVGESSFAILGSQPAIHFAPFVLSGFILLISILGYRARAKPWYESKVVDSASGKLMESKD